MSISADDAASIKVVQRDEVAREPVMIRSDIPTELCQGRVAVALTQVAQHLIVGSVFFDDVEHMIDAQTPQVGGGGMIRRGVERIVVGADGLRRQAQISAGERNHTAASSSHI